MRKKRKFNLILIIFVIVLVLGLGYAYLTTTLSINGTTDVDSNSWNVYWDNVQVSSGSVTATTPTISNQTTVSFSVHLSKPGDYYEFTVDAKNAGTIDAMIDTITKTINNSTTVPNYLNYTITYNDDIPIAENHLLAANSTKTYKVRVEYRSDINPSDLPNSSQNLSLSFEVEYIQGDDNAISVRTIYETDNNLFTIGSSIPTGVTTYNNYQDAVTTFGETFFLKHIVENNIVTKSYVGFILSNNVYYLQGAINESASGSKPVYEANKIILQAAFGSSNCTDNTTSYTCFGPASTGNVFAATNGIVYIIKGERTCRVNNTGTSYCNIEFST